MGARGIYLFTLEKEFVYKTRFLSGITFLSDWLSVEQVEGETVITVPKNYSWDGCSPKFKICGKIIGTPDGKIDPKTGKPVTYYASLIHDALYQFRKEIAKNHNVSVKEVRKKSDQIFLNILFDANFGLALPYYIAVRIFGGIGRSITNWFCNYF